MPVDSIIVAASPEKWQAPASSEGTDMTLDVDIDPDDIDWDDDTDDTDEGSSS